MLGVKRLAELRRGLLQGEAPGEGGRQLARGPELMAIEGLENGDGPAAAGPRLLTFQGSELSPELQAAMAGDGPEPLPLPPARSPSQESIGARSRGSGHSQEQPAPQPGGGDHSTPQERNLPEGTERPPKLCNPLPSQGPPPYVFMYPQGSPSGPAPGPPPGAPRAFSYLAGPPATPPDPPRPKRRSHSLSRPGPAEGEAEAEAEGPVGSALGSYATLTRRPGRSALARTSPSQTPSRGAPRSQSFALRARRKGPPPPPPKRLSSVSGPTPEPPPLDGSPGPKEGATGPRRRTLSEPPGPSEAPGPAAPAGPASDTEEEEPGPEGTPPSRGSSGEGLPFAEEGNLTIKQRPKPAGPPARETPVPAGLDFNLTESDTVKRRPKCREREPLQTALLAFGVATAAPSPSVPLPSQAPGESSSASPSPPPPDPSSLPTQGAPAPLSPSPTTQPPAAPCPGPALENSAGSRRHGEPEPPAFPAALIKVPGAGMRRSLRGRALFARAASSPAKSHANVCLQEQLPSLYLWPAPSWHFPALSWLPGSAPAQSPRQGQRALGLRARAGPSRDWSRPARPWQLRCGRQRRASALRRKRGEDCWVLGAGWGEGGGGGVGTASS